VSTRPEDTGGGYDGEPGDRHHGDGYPDDRHPDAPPLPRGARVLRTVAVVAIVIGVLVGVVGVWRAQTSQVSADKLAERHAHERAYSQLVGGPSGPGAARVDNITVTDAQIFRAGESAAGTLVFTVHNSSESTRIQSVDVAVGGAPVARVLYVPRPGADPAPLPGDGIVLDRHAEAVFAADGKSFALIGLPAGTDGQRADVVLTVDGVGRVAFEAPVRDTGVGAP
jgi:hypothetical protein